MEPFEPYDEIDIDSQVERQLKANQAKLHKLEVKKRAERMNFSRFNHAYNDRIDAIEADSYRGDANLIQVAGRKFWNIGKAVVRTGMHNAYQKIIEKRQEGITLNPDRIRVDILMRNYRLEDDMYALES